MKYKVLSFVLITIIIFQFDLKAQGYEIKVKIRNLKNDTILLGHYFADKMYPDDTTVLINGSGVFKNPKPLPEGMYFIYLPTKQYFDILITNDQQFAIENDTTDFTQNIKVAGSNDNQIFADYNRFMMVKYSEVQNLKDKKTQAGNNPSQTAEIDKQIDEIIEIRDKELERIISSYPNTFFAKFLKATKDITMPDRFFKNGQLIDSLYIEYRNYYLDHYFDLFDFKDQRLLRTPIYQRKLEQYLKAFPPNVDSINRRVDSLIVNTRHNAELHRFMLAYLFNYYNESQMMLSEEVFVHIAERYYLTSEAEWYSDDQRKKLKERIDKTKPNLIGKIAPELIMQSLPKDINRIEQLKADLVDLKEKGIKAKGDGSRPKQDIHNDWASFFNEYAEAMDSYISLSAVKANYTVIWFWDPECSHCKKETPYIAEMHKKFKPLGVEVYAVCVQTFIEDWDKFTKSINDWYDFVLSNQMNEMTNVWDVYHQSKFRDKYNVYSAPVSYLLDKDKKIIIKRITDHAKLEEILTDFILSDIKDQYQGTERITKIKEMADRFTEKRNLENMLAMVSRYFVGNERDELTGYIEAKIDNAGK